MNDVAANGETTKILLEQYKVIRTSITDLQHDRNTNNNFLVAIVTFVVGGEGYLLKTPIEAATWPMPVHLLIVLAVIASIGIGLCLIWIRWNRSYGTALAVRYTLLKRIEEYLPAKPFTDEPQLRESLGYESITSVIEKLARFFMGVFLVQLPMLVLLAAVGHTPSLERTSAGDALGLQSSTIYATPRGPSALPVAFAQLN
jgi:hypothetical protein